MATAFHSFSRASCKNSFSTIVTPLAIEELASFGRQMSVAANRADLSCVRRPVAAGSIRWYPVQTAVVGRRPR